MRGIAADICAQIHGVLRGGEEAEIRAVRIVHGEHRIVLMADLGERSDIRHAAQVIRAGDVDGGGRLGKRIEHARERIGRDLAGAQRGHALRMNPDDVKVQQRGGKDEGLMHVARGDDGAGCAGAAAGKAQMQHRADALAGALGGVQRPGRAEEGGSVPFALRDDAGGLVQRVRAGDFGDVQRFAAEKCPAFVTGHVKPCRAGFRIAADKISDGRVHRNIPRIIP